MPAGRFAAQHGTRAGDDAGKPDQDMKTDEGQEYGRGRGYLDPREDNDGGMMRATLEGGMLNGERSGAAREAKQQGSN